MARALATVAPDAPIVLAGYSAACPILPAIGGAVAQPIALYAFVDAGLPGRKGQSRLDLRAPEDAAEVRGALEAGRRFPEWAEDDLAGELPDPDDRRRVVAEHRPRPAAYHDEPLFVPEGWPDVPCAFLRFSDGYARDADRARELGWPTLDCPGGHFQLLIDPVGVADALERLAP